MTLRSLSELVEDTVDVDLGALSSSDSAAIQALLDHVADMAIEEQGGGPRNNEPTPSQRELFEAALRDSGIDSGSIAELGGAKNSFAAEMPDYRFTFLSLFTVQGDDRIIAADITDCDYLPDESFDAIYSQAVLEHVDRPWQAARNIRRLLKPGGVTFHSAPFSYFYHGAPADFWRYTPRAFEVLFSGFEPLGGGFLSPGRRRDNRGTEQNPIDGHGESAFAVDSFGGWRENWSAWWCGRKSDEYLASHLDQNRRQVILDLVKGLTLRGFDEEAAVRAAALAAPNFLTDETGRVRPAEPGMGMQFSADEIRTIWKRRGRDGIRPSHARFKVPILMGVVPPPTVQ